MKHDFIAEWSNDDASKVALIVSDVSNTIYQTSKELEHHFLNIGPKQTDLKHQT